MFIELVPMCADELAILHEYWKVDVIIHKKSDDFVVNLRLNIPVVC
jgi:hypothetical protein